MDAIQMLKTRRCVRTYASTPVPKETIEAIIDCGRLAATARNQQPWEFVVVQDADTRARLAAITSYGKFIADAPVCVVVVCKDSTYYVEDGAAASQNILLAARAYGLASCWVAGDKKPYAGDILAVIGVPAGYKLVSLIPIGHSTDEPKPQKRALAEVLHWEKF